MEAGQARPIALELGYQNCHTGGQLLPYQVTGACRGTLDQVGEAEAVRRQSAVMLRFQSGDAKSATCCVAQRGTRETGPEAIAVPGEVVTHLDRVQRRVDANEHYV